MAKIAFIGRERILQVCNYFGTSVFQVSTPQEAQRKLQELAEDTEEQWGIIYLEEGVAETFLDQIADINSRPLPVVSLFPSRGEKKELSGKILDKLVRKVTGVEIRFE